MVISIPRHKEYVKGVEIWICSGPNGPNMYAFFVDYHSNQ